MIAMTDTNRPIRVVLVDDHTTFLEVLRSLTSRCRGVEVVGVAANGLQAMERIETLLPDVVLMDVAMPKLDGIETTRTIKSRHPEMTIIGVSHNATKNEAAMRKAGASEVIEKEHLLSQLCATIRKAMA
jgi:DNA-binding NarL/FixJ family response regulator